MVIPRGTTGVFFVLVHLGRLGNKGGGGNGDDEFGEPAACWFRRAALSLSDPVDRQPELETPLLPPNFARRLLPHLVADVVAVSVGLGIFWAWSGRPPRLQCLFALGFVVVAIMADAFHVRLERGYVEELVLAAKVAVVALLITAVGGFLLDRTLSRVLFLSLALTLVVTRPLAAVIITGCSGLSARPLRAGRLQRG